MFITQGARQNRLHGFRRAFAARLLSLLLLLALPAMVQAQFTFITNNGAITITGYQMRSVGAVVIPSTTNGYPVTSIGNDAFFNGQGIYSKLTSVTIPNSVTNVGDGAFAECGGLTNITIGTNVINIGTDAFQACNGLTNIAIPASVISIGNEAFADCGHLTAITIDTNNPTYSSVAGVLFDKSQATLIQCPGGKVGSFTVPNTVSSIGTNAFRYCTALTNITITAGVTNIGYETFEYCASLTTITVNTNNSTYSSPAGVLFDKSQTTLIQYPENRVGSYTIPDSVVCIGDEAFFDSSGLTNVIIGTNVTSIGDYAFSRCGLTSAIISNSITIIGDDAFYKCPNLNSVSIGDSATSIGSWTFADCNSLTSVTIGNGVTSIGSGDFQFCTTLTNVTIGNNVTSIGMAAFEGCYKLTGVMIPDTVTNIGYEAFLNFHLVSVFFLGNAPAVDSSAFSYDAATAYYLPGTTGWGNFAASTGLPTALWLPQVQTSNTSFGMQTNQFGFNINWASGQTVVVEACTDISNPVWQPVQTNTLASGASYFSDSQWTNYPGRFYRLRSP